MRQPIKQFVVPNEHAQELTVTFSFKVEMSPFDGGFEVWSPNLPGITSWGKTESIAFRNMRNGLAEHLMLLIETHGPIPKPIRKQVVEQSRELLQSANFRASSSMAFRRADGYDLIEYTIAM